MANKQWLSMAEPGDPLKGFPSDQVPSHASFVRYKGPFDFTYVYRTVKRWFEQRRFRFYDHRHKDSGKRIKDDWEATRVLDEYFTETYTVTIEMWNLSTHEIIVNGEPRKILNGMVQFTIRGVVNTDRLKFFKGKTGFLGWLGNRYMDVRWREIEMKYIDVMEYRTQDVQTVIKQCLGMTTKENTAW